MGIGVGNVFSAFELLYVSLLRRSFSKTLRLHEWGEQDLLPLVRTFLLGYFGESIVPEAVSKLPGSLSGKGRIDFIVGDVAIEFAVRKPDARRSTLSASVNIHEVKKLMKYPGQAVLILYDFSKTPYTREQIEKFRNWPSLGQGSHKKSPFNVIYFYIESRRPLLTGSIKMNIRVC
jgi:hypothetical protein